MPFNELRAITAFAKAIELGSIRKAALAQGITPQAASHSIAQLERHLGVRLLHRTTRSLAATEEGRHLLEQAVPALSALDGALAQVKEARQAIAGPLRIVGPKSGFAPVWHRLLHEFCQKHPAVQPEVQLADEIGDWVLDRVDVGFRYGTQHPGSGLVARRLFPVQLIVCASPAYLERHGAPATPGDLSAHRCSTFRSHDQREDLPVVLRGRGCHRGTPAAARVLDQRPRARAAGSARRAGDRAAGQRFGRCSHPGWPSGPAAAFHHQRARTVCTCTTAAAPRNPRESVPSSTLRQRVCTSPPSSSSNARSWKPRRSRGESESGVDKR